MKLVIQIPCWNEEDQLAATVAAIPRSVPGFDAVEVLVVDDGSTDDTVGAARRAGVEHVVLLRSHQGLAAAFRAGLAAALEAGADVIVNTDADNQYRADDIPALVEPIVRGVADIVVGARPIEQIDDFSWTRKRLQRIGSWVVRVASGTAVEDATSGFRAFSRDAAMQLSVLTTHTHTLDTLIEAGRKGLSVASVPIRTNPKIRDSRLIRSVPQYVWRSAVTIIRVFVLYEPFRFFGILGGTLFLAGFLIGLRFLYYFLQGLGGGHVQSLILGAVLLLAGVQLVLVGLLADLIAANRKLSEEIRYRLRKEGAAARKRG